MSGLAASGADDRADQLAELTRTLTARIEAATRAFEARRPHEAAAGQAETADLAAAYRQEALRIRRDPSLLSGADPGRLKALTAATEAFDAALARHGRAIEAARTITEGLVQAIAAEVAAHRAPAAGYGRTARATSGDARAIALNARA